MENIWTAWLVLTGLLGLMAILVIWTRRDSALRGLGVVLFVVSIGSAPIALASALGWAVPILPGITAMGGDYVVLGAKMVIGKAIYVLVDGGETEPRYYRLAWNKDLANKIQDMLDDPGNDAQNGGGVIMSVPYELSFDMNAPQFRPLPQPKVLPDKPPEPAAPHFNPDRAV